MSGEAPGNVPPPATLGHYDARLYGIELDVAHPSVLTMSEPRPVSTLLDGRTMEQSLESCANQVRLCQEAALSVFLDLKCAPGAEQACADDFASLLEIPRVSFICGNHVLLGLLASKAPCLALVQSRMVAVGDYLAGLGAAGAVIPPIYATVDEMRGLRQRGMVLMSASAPSVARATEALRSGFDWVMLDWNVAMGDL